MVTENTEENCLYIRTSGMLSVECDDDLIILLESDQDEMLGLNATARFLWSELESSKTLEQLIGSVLDVFEVDREQAALDVRAFLTQMAASGLVA